MFKSINGGQLPQRATKYSAGFDVFANEDVVIGAGETKTIELGICLDIDSMIDNNGWVRKSKFEAVSMEEFNRCFYFELHPRSSLRAKGLGGGVGIIDMDYRDEIKMVITNPMCSVVDSFMGFNTMGVNRLPSFKISKGDKIGQLILKRHEGWLLPSGYTKDEERAGGFGSTDG